MGLAAADPKMDQLRVGIDKAIIADTRRTTEADEDANEALQKAVRGCKPEDLDGVPFPEQAAVLRCLCRRTVRKISRRRAQECLGLLLANPDWIRAAQGNIELLGALKEAVADNPEILATLNEVVPDPGASKVQKSKEVDMAKLSERRAAMEKQLRAGVHKCRDLKWEFLDIDAGVVQYNELAKKTDPGQPVSLVIQNLNEEDAAGIVEFLFKMHVSKVRISQYSKMMDVIAAFSRDSDSFREAASKKTWTQPGEPAPSLPSTEGTDNPAADEPPTVVTPATTAATPAAQATPSASPLKAASPHSGQDTRHPIVMWLDQDMQSVHHLSKFKDPNRFGLAAVQDPGDKIGDDVHSALNKVVLDEAEAKRLDVLIMHRKHLPLVKDLIDTCEPAPLFIVVPRDSEKELPDPPEGAQFVFERDWNRVAERAKQEVQRRSKQRSRP
mmetsp:Transcript_18610/g.40051  ORF Transcript_18610/g.40051 Transcript_18610/m.40051 type:complete len:442 (-) Transcript_18610:161-1486(-)